MGQRLVFECVKDGEVFACIYFHWSAYTDQIYVEAKKLIDGLMKRGYCKDWNIPQIQKTLADILYEDFVNSEGKVLRVIPERSGGIYVSYAEIDAFADIGYDIYKLDKNRISRSCGVISIVKDTWKDMKEHAGDIETIDFDNETFTNYLFYEEEPSEDILGATTYENIPDWNPPSGYTEEIKWKDREKALTWYFDNYGKNNYYILGKLNNGNVMTSVC
jgi:hypothetical protein